MPPDSDSLDAILDLMMQLETTLLGLRQLRAYVGTGEGVRMLDQVRSKLIH